MRQSVARLLRGIAQRLDPQPILEDYEDWDWTPVWDDWGNPMNDEAAERDFVKPYAVERDDGR